jgi:4-amino-4-deoxy-L-arabinose transferase-like glycosyltransferase
LLASLRRAASSLLRAVPKSVLLITALWVSLLVGASLLWPMTYGYDEPQHIDMAYVYAGDPFHLYDPGELLPTEANVRIQEAQPGYPPRYRFRATPIEDRGDRPSFDDLGGRQPVVGAQPNQMVQHPPLPYWIDAAVLRLPFVSSLAWDLQVWLMRLAGVVLASPLPLLCWATTRRLLTAEGSDVAGRAALVAAIVPLGIPNLVRDVASVTNDTLLVTSTSVLVYLLSRVLTGDVRLRVGIGIGTALAVALLSKAFAIMLPPFIVVAYLLAGWRTRRWREAFVPLVAAGIGGLVGASWWIRNQVVYGTVQPTGYGPGYERILFGEPDGLGTVGPFLPRFLTDLTMRIWGGIGLPDAPYPGHFLAYSWLAVTVVGVAAALLIRSRAHARVNAWVLYGMVAATVLTVTKGSFGLYRLYSDVPRSSQGRYLYHLLVVIVALGAIGWARAVRSEAWRRLPVWTLVAALGTIVSSWVMIIKSWYAGGVQWRSFPDGLYSLLVWSPVPWPVTVLGVVVVPSVLGGLCLWHLFRLGSGAVEQGGEVPPPERLGVDRPNVLA